MHLVAVDFEQHEVKTLIEGLGGQYFAAHIASPQLAGTA